MLRILSAIVLLVVLLTACEVYDPLVDYDVKQPVTLHDVPVIPSDYPPEQVARGKYLAEILACGVCHTDGALVGEPDMTRHFAGSSTGTAYSNPLVVKKPGVVYPANITPDPETGIGRWNDDALMRLLRTGVDAHGEQQLPVMPWPAYARIVEEDAPAIIAFLRSLEPVRNKVPKNVEPGQRAVSPYVHFGVYESKR